MMMMSSKGVVVGSGDSRLKDFDHFGFGRDLPEISVPFTRRLPLATRNHSIAMRGMQNACGTFVSHAVPYLLILPTSSFTILAPFASPRRLTALFATDVVDVNFFPVERSDDADTQPATEDSFLEQKSNNLFDLSFESDPDFLDTKIPFIDATSMNTNGINFIEVKLAFMAELDNAQYGIAVPYDFPVAITLEEADGYVKYLSPDLDENEELMEIMAGQLNEHVGDDLRLQRTPRVLTVSGPLDNYTKDWKTKLVPSPVAPADLMSKVSDDKNDLDFFHDFMRRELGEEEYQKTLTETPDEDEINNLLQLFEVPGLGNLSNDTAGIEDMLKTLLTPEDDFEAAKESLGITSMENDSVALKLVSYVFAGGKAYSLVKLLKPFVIVGKYCTDAQNNPRFELLTREEEERVIPRLEQVCKNDLATLGLTL